MADYPDNTEFPPEQYPYRIRNWKKYQHYKKRNPPWIKLHFTILSSEDFVVLDDASKLLAVVCMLIASRHEGHIPASASPAYFKRVAYLEKTPNLKPLIECGFLQETLADASIGMQELATARPETETETETEKKVLLDHPSDDPKSVLRETKKKEKGTTDGSKGTRLPEGWLPSSEVHLFAVGLLGESGTAYQLDKFRDYWLGKAGAAARKTDWDRTFRNWCRSAKERTGNGYNRPQTLKERTADALQRLGSGSLGEIVDIGLPKLGLD